MLIAFNINLLPVFETKRDQTTDQLFLHSIMLVISVLNIKRPVDISIGLFYVKVLSYRMQTPALPICVTNLPAFDTIRLECFCVLGYLCSRSKY